MFSFLHVGDIHLGYRQYKLAEREKDFFKAFHDICQKWAIQKNADFVLITGDLFNNRSISPQTFNEAVFVLNELKQAGIPVIAIEGNHDFKEAGNFSSQKGSWFEALAQNGLLYFLYPDYKDGEILLKPLELGKKFVGGGYLDLPTQNGFVRLVGSRWQGFNAGAMLPEFKQAISNLPSEPDFTVFLFHAGHESYLPINRGGVSTVDFNSLVGAVDYVALGHIHDQHILQNSLSKDFLFNPGSTEANSFAEAGIKRGGFYTTVKSRDEFTVEPATGFYNRPFIKLKPLEVHKFANHQDLIEAAYNLALTELKLYTAIAPVVQVNMSGFATFDRLNSELLKLKESIESAGALYCQIKWDTQSTSTVYVETEAEKHLPRIEVEKLILERIISADDSVEEPGELFKSMLRVKDLVINSGAEAEEVLAEIKSHEITSLPV